MSIILTSSFCIYMDGLSNSEYFIVIFKGVCIIGSCLIRYIHDTDDKLLTSIQDTGD
jgi:hypothetical protein